MPRTISADEGLTIRVVPLDAESHSGMTVTMIKSEPGTYYDDHGNEVNLETAKLAGFDIKMNRTRKKVLERKAEATARIEKEVEFEEARADVLGNPPFSAVHKGNGRYDVIDQQGKAMNESTIPKAAAEKLAFELCEKEMAKLDQEYQEPGEEDGAGGFAN